MLSLSVLQFVFPINALTNSWNRTFFHQLLSIQLKLLFQFYRFSKDRFSSCNVWFRLCQVIFCKEEINVKARPWDVGQNGCIVFFIWRDVDASLFSQIYKIYFAMKWRTQGEFNCYSLRLLLRKLQNLRRAYLFIKFATLSISLSKKLQRRRFLKGNFQSKGSELVR